MKKFDCCGRGKKSANIAIYMFRKSSTWYKYNPYFALLQCSTVVRIIASRKFTNSIESVCPQALWPLKYLVFERSPCKINGNQEKSVYIYPTAKKDIVFIMLRDNQRNQERGDIILETICSLLECNYFTM